MMTRNTRDKGPSTKQEPGLDDGRPPPAAAPAAAATTGGRPPTCRSWPGHKDPRIVRVSRTFGGKDRHSKVSTVRGLRDRRVRLSVQTAIQLYDLQDRLGVNQPSKVVDWLLDAAQQEIDRLPPLQIPPGSFIHYASAAAAAAPHGVVGLAPASAPTATGSLSLLPAGRASSGNRDHVEHQTLLPRDHEREDLLKRMEQDQHHVEVIPMFHDSLHRVSFSSMPGNSSSSNPYAPYCLLEASSASVPHLAGGYVVSQAEEQPPSLSLSHGSQLLLCPSGGAPSMFSLYAAASAGVCDPRHANSTVFQLGSSASSQSSRQAHHF